MRILTPTAQDLGKITPGPLPLTKGKVSLVWEGCAPQQWAHLEKKAVGWAGMPIWNGRRCHRNTILMPSLQRLKTLSVYQAVDLNPQAFLFLSVESK